jgi:hypothetical protein
VSSGVQIGLPPGSYVPEFKLISTSSKPQEDSRRTSEVGFREAAGLYRSTLTMELANLAARWARGKLRPAAFKPYIVWLVALLIGLVPVIAFALHRIHSPKIVDEMWGPLFKSPGSVQIVIGNGIHENASPADPQHETLITQLHGAYDRLSVCDVVAVSRLAAMLGNQSRSYEIKEANFTSLQDLRNRSVILIGAYNNLWTLRLMEPLRFHFLKDGHSVRIVDAKNPQNGGWLVDYSKGSLSAVNDYAIVARYSDPTTNSSVMIIAGIGAYGTQAASEAVATPHDLEKLLASMPKDWPQKNLEVIVKTTIINGEAGPAQAVSATTW